MSAPKTLIRKLAPALKSGSKLNSRSLIFVLSPKVSHAIPPSMKKDSSVKRNFDLIKDKRSRAP